jgi:Asp-tRNA(Asn)/Glu-tRNA(Gln) amidotransferase A subunit family amidase
MQEPHQLTIAEAAGQINQRRLSPVELMESLLARADALEPDLKIWVTLDPEAALRTARDREGELEQKGPRGPLHGIPVGVKDIYYTEGVRTTACSPIYADFVPEYDSTIVALLKDAGAIIMGKTVTTEFACGDPPPTRNPWNAAHTPGGSSSGSAVGVAARVFPASMGSQTAGSVLRPASYNGVVGLKPTFGRISRYGVIPVAWSLDTMGCFTRTVEDAALMLSVLAGHDSQDFSTSSKPVPDYHAAIGSQQSPPRIGLVRGFFDERSDDETRSSTDEAIQSLGRAGADIEEVTLPTDFEALLAAHRVVMTVEAAAIHQTEFGDRSDDYSPNVRGVIEEGLLTPGVTYVQAQRIRRRFRRDVEEAIQGFDILITPTTATPAPRDLGTTGDPMFQSPWTTGGFPAITLPSGLSASGLPLGIQMVSAPFGEETLLAAAHWCEAVLNVHLEPPVKV